MALAKWIAASCAALALAACGEAEPSFSGPATQGVTDAMLAAADGNEWLTYGRDYGEQRFSPLTQISAANVGDLGLAWYADLDTARGQEATPLMHDGVLYVSTAWSMVKAYDAKTGTLIWEYDPEVPRETLVRACCDAVNRGVALYGDKVFVATLDGRLVALDQKTGAVEWTSTVVPNQEDYTITGAPRVAGGRVFIGTGGAEYRARGFIAAYDWENGEELWRWHTVPGNPADGFENDAMEMAASTWGGNWWELGGGGTVWDSITYDPVNDLVLFGTGNAEPWNPAVNDRNAVANTQPDTQGDNLFTSSIVALHADSGEYAWHFQQTPEDRWDYDSNAGITLADMTIKGEQRHVVLHAPKNGYFYVLDAASGAFIQAEAWTALNWSTGIDPVTGKPEINPQARYELTGETWTGLPGAAGAHSWQPMSYSPDTGLVYIPANLTAFPYRAAGDDWEPSALGFQTGIDGAGTAMPAIPEIRQAALDATTGALVAWDPVAGREAWRHDYIGPWNGGTLATAGNLVFQGSAGEQFAAFNATSGERLWSFATQSGVMAAPMTYAIDGEQYVAVLVGWGGIWDIAPGVMTAKSGRPRNISRLMVFKLGATGQLPAPPALAEMVLDPPAFTGTPQQVAAGAQSYGRYCGACHGDAGIAGALNPDLRHSGAIGDGDVMRMVLIDGALHERGMVSFASVLNADDAENIRQYLISRANEDKALENR
ncbi:PQQ-dependent methanol/ethanol family dehydrogenase [Alteraurantiacibacter aestuarii]|uniref:PQQ-dependent dehydrogenase, methanol/ethanol family n=1 Tax=Alteraurantiacibacter aestuarii TaxID=650004 RepID=A0A844ZKE6_9SPHN|nr:PQQ-dependent dehydrogenase, methanol/ethanol family [Alteraurantiacibacter aestuarii]MXO88275.1 PQQ-dependent dehydrogenase, methanol/ethanol family [Alteraurantiacibacter aestuarii]